MSEIVYVHWVENNLQSIKSDLIKSNRSGSRLLGILQKNDPSFSRKDFVLTFQGQETFDLKKLIGILKKTLPVREQLKFSVVFGSKKVTVVTSTSSELEKRIKSIHEVRIRPPTTVAHARPLDTPPRPYPSEEDRYRPEPRRTLEDMSIRPPPPIDIGKRKWRATADGRGAQGRGRALGNRGRGQLRTLDIRGRGRPTPMNSRGRGRANPINGILVNKNPPISMMKRKTTPNEIHKKLTKASSFYTPTKFNPNVIPNTPPNPLKPRKKEAPRESLRVPAFVQNQMKKSPSLTYENLERPQVLPPEIHSKNYSGVRSSKKRKVDHDSSERKRPKHSGSDKKRVKQNNKQQKGGQKFDRSPFEKKLMQELRFRPLSRWSCDDVYHFLLRQFEDAPIVAEELKSLDGTQLPYHASIQNGKFNEDQRKRLQYLVSSLGTLDQYKPFPSGHDIKRRWMKLFENRNQFLQGLIDNFPIEKSATVTMNHFIVNVLEKKMKQRVEKLVYTYSLQFTGGLPPTRVMMENVKHVFRANWDVKIFCDFQKLAEKAVDMYCLPQSLKDYLADLYGIIYAMDLHIPKLKFFPAFDWYDGKDGSVDREPCWLGIKTEDEGIICKPLRMEQITRPF